MDNYQKVAAHGLIRNREGKILVTRRSKINDWQPLTWDVPGGTVEFGEEPQAALHREILEETNLTVKVEKPIYVFAYLSSPERHQFQIVYDCEYISGNVRLNPEEHDEFKWIDKSDLKILKNKIAFLKGLSDNT